MAGNPQQLLALRADPASIAPERAIVFEVEGSLEDFYAQARSIGLDYLGDYEEEFDPSADFYNKQKPAKKLGGRIYLAMPNVQALRELISLWTRYKDHQRMPAGRGQWTQLFSRLIDVRPWGPEDRIPEETVEAWEEELAAAPLQPVRIEIELWFHESAQRRATAFQEVEEAVVGAGGSVVHHAVIEDVQYDAALVDVPAQYVRNLIDHRNVSLARHDEIMFLRPQSLVRNLPLTEHHGADGPEQAPPIQFDGEAPLAALLDGLPIQNHVRLANRLIVDDPEELEGSYPVTLRAHGTEMASLIIHGDLNVAGEPIGRPLYVRPVLRPNAAGEERTAQDRLLLDVIFQAVRRMKEGDAGNPPSAPSVVVVNFSLADEKRPFARIMSPLGRLLDFLSYRYGVLFLVSAGNIRDRLKLESFENSIAFEAATPEQRERAILLALNANKSQRTLLSPAEAVNALTIGAAHAGSAFNGAFPANRFDPFTDSTLPNVVSAMGLGFRKTVKPEVLFDGGRAPIHIVASGQGSVSVAPALISPRLFGLKCASPSPTGGTRYEDFTWGTSAATALATRAAHRICDMLLDEAQGSNHANIESRYLPVVMKALLVHGAQWGKRAELLDEIFEPQGQGGHHQRRDDISRLLGFGTANIDAVLDCATNRATLLGWGMIAPDSAVLYRIPLPPELEGQVAARGTAVTVAWLSPINPRHKGYRMAALDVSAASDDKYWIVEDRNPFQPTDKATVRGTIFHERRTGESAKVFVDDGHLLLRLSCRGSAGTLTEAIPYAMAISFEVGIDTGIAVYEAIRTRLLTPVPAQVGAG